MGPGTTEVAKVWHYRSHDGMSFRVWRNDWPSDMFEVIGAIEFHHFQVVCEKVGVPLTLAED